MVEFFKATRTHGKERSRKHRAPHTHISIYMYIYRYATRLTFTHQDTRQKESETPEKKAYLVEGDNEGGLPVSE